jgi:hypothetical protein
MSKDKKTGCECPLAGYCERHGVSKNSHLHAMCENHEAYFKMWDNCKGPGQDPLNCKKPAEKGLEEESRCEFCGEKDCSGECRNSQQLPSKMKMAKNLAIASKDHVKDSFAQAQEELQAERLEICKGCEFYIPEQDRCGKCGCFLKSKSAWKSSKCPIGKW